MLRFWNGRYRYFEHFLICGSIKGEDLSMKPALVQGAAALLFLVAVMGGGVCPVVWGADDLFDRFSEMSSDSRPHTRWWWMGNALRKEDIRWQLDQMREQGIGGVEQITMDPVYTRGNHAYLSPEYFELLRFAVAEAAKRDLSFSINFGGPGWIWGGDWVPKEDQSQVMLASFLDVEGPHYVDETLPKEAFMNPADMERSMAFIDDEDQLCEVVAARISEGKLAADSLTLLSPFVKEGLLQWQVPEGKWRIMAFWLSRRDNSLAVNHLNREAMERYCERLGAQYSAALGDYMGTTVESFFGDSFEVPIYRNGLYWSADFLDRFEKEMGYALTLWLPALWWEVDDLSSKIRYDVNAFLHKRGLDAFFGVFLDWCSRHGVGGRIQPYGFVTDTIEGAGKAYIPEMEITPGEKDAVPWYDPRIGPRAYVTSGAHLYGRNIVSAEAFTYLHWQPYRATLEELKIATDGFLCAGANKIYNHGFIASPERHIVPTRGFFSAIRISPENIWWRHYHYLSSYTARCCAALRYGQPVVDIAVYSPLANQWTKSVLNARKWTREFDFGELGHLLSVNGYAFDLVNDEVLQRADLDDGKLRLGEMEYELLILPAIESLPVESMLQLKTYIVGGGTVVALERVPEFSTGFHEYAARDEEVRQLSAELFTMPAGAKQAGEKHCGKGRSFCLRQVLDRQDPLDWHLAPFDPFLKTLREITVPDLESERTPAGRGNKEGLAFVHRRSADRDIYFVTNLQYTPSIAPLGFRQAQGCPFRWDPHTGTGHALAAYRREGSYTELPLSLAPFESALIVFEHSNDGAAKNPHVLRSDFAEILDAGVQGFTALADHNGIHHYHFHDGSAVVKGTSQVEGLPADFEISGTWTLKFPSTETFLTERHWSVLRSWTKESDLRHFSGTAHYSINFELPECYSAPDIRLRLSAGAVGNIAVLSMNGRPVGVHWMNGQEFELEGIIGSGENTLHLEVTNTLINRVAGMETFPDVPEALRPIFGETAVSSEHATAVLTGFEPLPLSGLLGPVRIKALREVTVAPANL